MAQVRMRRCEDRCAVFARMTQSELQFAFVCGASRRLARRVIPDPCCVVLVKCMWTTNMTRQWTKVRKLFTITYEPISRLISFFFFTRGLLHTWLNKDCSLWSPHAQQTHSERSRWSR